MWTARQRTALLTILCAIFAIMLVQTVRHRAYVPDPQPAESSRATELADRIDPNLADVDTLAALPTLGEKRAKMIVDYRERYRKMLPRGGEPYQRPEDLMRIRGIGAATVDQLRPFLTFPTTAPTTRDDQ